MTVERANEQFNLALSLMDLDCAVKALKDAKLKRLPNEYVKQIFDRGVELNGGKPSLDLITAYMQNTVNML